MDYLNPKKQLQQRILLFTGYVCMAIAITIATLILVYQAYGFGINRNGDVIQNGLLFFSSHPNPADIYVDGKLNKAQTNSRIILPAAIYDILIHRDGYRDWKRKIDVTGGSVQHFDYPLLVPKTLTTTKVSDVSALPGTALQSPDGRWVVAHQAVAPTDFTLYDLKNPRKVTVSSISLPAGLLSPVAVGTPSAVTISEWSDDSRHFLVKHTFGGATEYVLADRTNPAQSINLSKMLQTTMPDIRLSDKKYDQYFLYDPVTLVVSRATLQQPVITPLITHVLAFKTYGTKTVLYASDADVPDGKTAIRMLSDGKTYNIRSFAAGTTYLLDLATYSGDMYVIAGATSQSKVYIYHDPVGQLTAHPDHVAVPLQVLHVVSPNYVSFSTTAQFVMAESGVQFGIYDLENKNGYNYTSQLPLDAPQVHAVWPDGNHLTYVSDGKTVIFDYDNANVEVLTPAAPALGTFFAPDFNYYYAFNPATGSTGAAFDQTSLLIPTDQ